MKSAYELAMERLAKTEPKRSLTPDQKARLTEINSLYQSRLAERETFLQGLLAQAELSGNAAEAEAVRQQMGRDLPAIREEWDAKKERVWSEG